VGKPSGDGKVEGELGCVGSAAIVYPCEEIVNIPSGSE
jgi:hypothetical protein